MSKIGLVNLFSSVLPNVFVDSLRRNLDFLAVRFDPIGVTTDYTLKSTDEIDSVQADATAANMTIYLPISPTGNRRRRVIKTDTSANTVTVSGNGALINGAATYVLAAQYDRVWVEPTGTGWLIIN